MNALAIAVAVALVIGAIGSSEAREEACLSSEKRLCSIPFVAAYFGEDKYAGAQIAIRGFVRSDGTSFALYPDETAMRYLVREAALELKGLDAAGIKVANGLAGKFVRVVGVLDSPSDARYWGALNLRRPPQESPLVLDGPFEAAPPRPVDKRSEVEIQQTSQDDTERSN